MAAANPSIVIVPGAWCPAGLYQDFVVHLNNAGLSASVVDLPTCDVQDPVSVTVATDTQAVRDRILSLLDTENKDIIVLCHSYGGIPGGGGAAGLSKNARIREGKENGIVCLVYMTAFIVPEGPSLLDVMGGKHAPYVSENQPSKGQCTILNPEAVLFNDLDESAAKKYINLLRPSSLHAFDSRAPAPAWIEPEFAQSLIFLRCTKDQALPPPMQDLFVEKSGVAWEVQDIEASHCPFTSKPEEIVKVLRTIAG